MRQSALRLEHRLPDRLFASLHEHDRARSAGRAEDPAPCSVTRPVS